MHSGGYEEPLKHFRGEGLWSDLNIRTLMPAATATGTEDEAILQAVVPRDVMWRGSGGGRRRRKDLKHL